jgi:hypothetical protein
MTLLKSLLVVVCLLPALSQERSLTRDRRLTFDGGASLLSYNFARSVAADGAGRVHLVWYDDRDGVAQIYYKRSVDHGNTWEADTRLSPGPERQENPAVAAMGGKVYVVWHSLRNNGSTVFLKRSIDGGKSWEPETQVSTGDRAAFASVAVAGANVYVVWGDHRDGEQTEVYFRGSNDGGDGGMIWGPETRVSEPPFESWVPTVEASGRNVYVAWVDTRDGNEEEYFRRSADGGQTWGKVTRLTDNGANSWAPSLAADGETLHLVWFDQQDSPVQPLDAERRLDDVMRGMGLNPAPEPAGVMVTNPELAAQRRAGEKARLVERAAPVWVARGGDPARLQAILHDLSELGQRGASYLEKERKLDEAVALMGLPYTPGPTDDLPKIYYLDAQKIRAQDKLKQIQDAGPAWAQRGGNPQQLAAALHEFQRMMEIAASEWEIYYRRSTDGGQTWEAPRRLSFAPGPSARPSIATDGRELSVVWYDGREGAAEIYYKRSRDNGATWEPDTRLTNAPGDSLQPSVAAAGGLVHVAWYDLRDGNPEIYYRRFPSPPRRFW